MSVETRLKILFSLEWLMNMICVKRLNIPVDKQ